MIEKISSENPLAQSAQMIPENIARLAELFPDAFADGKVNVQKLVECIGIFAESEEEKFGLNWSGKQKAKQIALAPTNKTLRPNKEESKNWDTTENLYIEGDNLEVLKLLQKAYAGQIKMIYIDPPYNTGKDFVYSDKFAMANKDALVSEGLVDEDGSKVKSTDVYDVNTKNSARYHTNWLNMMYPRLRLARNLLAKDGVIFVSIEDTEYTNLQKICDEIFGEENFLANIIIQSNKRGQTYKDIAKTHEYLLVYGKSNDLEVYELEKKDGALPYNDANGSYDLWELRNRNPKFGRHNRANLFYPIYVALDKMDGDGYNRVYLEPQSKRDIKVEPINSEGAESCWRWGKPLFLEETIGELPSVVAKQKRDGSWGIYEKSRKSTTKAKTIWDETSVISEQGTIELGNLELSTYFQFPKPIGLIQKALRVGMGSRDIILDFFSGSATTAHAVMQLNAEDQGNRKFILVQIPEACAEDSEAAKAGYANICEIGKERIRRAGEKIKLENAGKEGINNLDVGFRVFKLDTSNIKEWNTETDDLLRDLFNHQDHLDEKRGDEDILFELMLKLNRPLTAPIETKKIAKQTVFCVDGGALMVCLPKPKTLTSENVEALSEGIIQWHQETGYISGPNNQAHFVFRDTAFADDVAKANLSAIFEQVGYNNLRSL